MIMAAITAIMGRWQIAAGVVGLLVMTHGLAYCEGRSAGREAMQVKLEKARIEAISESLERVRKGDIAGAKVAEKQAVERAIAIKQIEQAEADGRNSLDELF